MSFNKERRSRLKLPWGIKIVAIVLILMPIINMSQASLISGIPFWMPGMLLGKFNLVGKAMLLLSPLTGIVILFVNKWSLRLFIVYAVLLITYNLYELYSAVSPYIVGSLLRTIIGFSLLFFILRRDILAPFMGLDNRGFRHNRRKELKLNFEINNTIYSCLDISKRGCYLNWIECPHTAGMQINIKPENSELALNGGIVRIDQSGVGIAWRSLTKKQKKFLHSLL